MHSIGIMKSRNGSNKPFNYSRPYPSGFHAFKAKEEEPQKPSEVDLSRITFPGDGIPWNSETCSWTLPKPHVGVHEFTGSSQTNDPQPSGSGLNTQCSSKRKCDLNSPM